MTINRLEWDSEFFGRIVSSIEIHSGMQVGVVVDACRHALRAGARSTCYIYAEDQRCAEQFIEEISRSGISVQPFGSVVQYRKTDLQASTDDVGPGVARLTLKTDEICDLACESGAYSRFRNDSVLKSHFRHLYERWISNAFEMPGVEAWGIWDSGRLAGIVSMVVRATTASIDLLAVSETCRRRGVGRRLIGVFEQRALACGCTDLTVKTQGANMPARRLYESAGYTMVKERWVWHAHGSGKEES